MPYRTYTSGYILQPQDLQDINDFVYDPLTQSYRKLDDSFLSDASTDLKSRFQTYSEELRVSKVSGLTVSWNSGKVRFEDGSEMVVVSGTLNVADNATSFIFVNEDGNVVSSTDQPGKVLRLAQVVASSGVVASVTDTRARWLIPSPFGGGSGSDTYTLLDLTDTPSSYSGHGGRLLAIREDESGLEFVPRPSTSAGSYSVIDKIRVVDGQEITLQAGITEIRNDIALLPTVTSSSDPNASRCSASSIYSSSFPAWKALTHGDTSSYAAWLSPNSVPPSVTPQWWQYDFASPVTLGRITWSNRSHSSPNEVQGQLKDFKIQKQDGSGGFTDLLSVNDHPSAGTGVLQTASLSATESAVEKLRIYITEIYTTNRNYAEIAQIQAYSQTTASSGLGQIIGGFTKARKAILGGVAQAGGKVFVTCGYSNETDRILMIDATSKSMVGDFDLGDTTIYNIFTTTSSAGGSFSYGVQLQQEQAPVIAYDDENKLYVAVGAEVKVFSETNGNLIETIDCGVATEIQGLGISVEKQKIYVASKAGAITVIDASTDTIAATLTASDDAAFGGENFAIAVDDTRDAVYISSRSTNKVLVLNTTTDTLVTSISVGSQPEGIALSTTLGKAVVCNRAANTVSVINTTNNTVGGSIAMSETGSGAQPSAVGIDEANGKAVVCLNAYHQVVILDMTSNQVEGRAATDPNPNGAVFIPATGEIYVSSENGTVTVITSANN